MNGWTAKDMPDQTDRVVVITGANSGVGYESAVAFAKKNAQVIMACRSMDKAEKAHQDLLKRAPNAKVEIMLLDLGNLKSVRDFADNFNNKYDRLDILMNNAGIMIPPYGKTVDGFETQFGTNHLGHFALTGLLLPKILETPHSRIVTVSSSAYYLGRINFDDLQSAKNYNPAGAYSQSKLANILFSQELQRKLKATGANTISLASQPGYARTNLQNRNDTTPGIMEYIVYPLLKRFLSHSAEVGATYQLYAATAPDVKGGEYYQPKRVLIGDVVRSDLIARGKDEAVAKQLWQVSEQLTGVDYSVLDKPALAYA